MNKDGNNKNEKDEKKTYSSYVDAVEAGQRYIVDKAHKKYGKMVFVSFVATILGIIISNSVVFIVGALLTFLFLVLGKYL